MKFILFKQSIKYSLYANTSACMLVRSNMALYHYDPGYFLITVKRVKRPLENIQNKDLNNSWFLMKVKSIA